MNLRNSLSILTLLATATLCAGAQDVQEGPVPTAAIINVHSKNGTPLDPAMLKLQVNRHDSPITSVTPVAPGSTQVAILIDDGLRGSFGLQIDDFKHFITALAPGTKVLIGYMQNGMVRSEGGFTANHDEAIDQLRITSQVAGVSASPYFCLSEFVKHWPSNETGARFVLMITNGVDPYNGSTSILNQDSPYVTQASRSTPSSTARRTPVAHVAASAARATWSRSPRPQAGTRSTRAPSRRRRSHRTSASSRRPSTRATSSASRRCLRAANMTRSTSSNSPARSPA
jgi:hypothetical protein